MTRNLYRFAAFELDVNARELRLEGREIPLQPRVFDLLRYLVKHRDRVVSKDELLDALWPGVVVTEASLQRAVSLARAALQQGALGQAIRNYARRGYRFCAEDAEACSDEEAGTGGAGDAGPDDHFASSQWEEAARAFEAADRASPLDAAALERWAVAAQCAGDLPAAVAPLERAAAAYSARGEAECAARVTVALARIQLESMEAAVAQGCLRRAARLLEGLPRSKEHGYLAWMTARLHLYTGDLSKAIEQAVEAREIGRELGNVDIEAMGLLYWGIGLQASGECRAGLALQDEAAAAVLSDELSPLVGGIVYCGVISSCCNCGDWQRAEQWTESFTRWCERSNIKTFAGACLLHRAEVYAMSGKLERAQREIDAGDELIRVSAPWALGAAYRLLGDLHLARGELDEAERDYRHAYAHGRDPYPGYAMLLHHRGRSAEAISGLLRAAEMTHWVAAERKGCYLAHAAVLAADSGALDKARTILDALECEPDLWQAGAVAGQVDRARAEVALATGQPEEAAGLFRRAILTLQNKRALLEAAVVRMRLAQTLALAGERDSARLELCAAQAAFDAAGASWYAALCRQAQDAIGS